MLNKKEIKYIQSLDQKKHRDEEDVFIAEGPKMVCELLQMIPQQFNKLYAVQKWVKENQHLIKNIPHETITEIELERISGLKSPNEVVAVLKQFQIIVPVNFSLALYLDTIKDPGNFGTIIRIADWFGIKHIVCSEGCADVYNPKVVQSTMGSIGRVNIYYDEQTDWLKDQACLVMAATLDGTSVYEYNKIEKAILIIGNESKGIGEKTLQYATERITIPKRGEAESLNAAVATGILVSHLVGPQMQ